MLNVYDHQCEMLFFSYCTSYNVPLLDAAKNFTLLVKNNVQFPKFGESKYVIIFTV